MYIVDVLLNCDPQHELSRNADGTATGVRPCPEEEKGEPMVFLGTCNCMHLAILVKYNLFPGYSCVTGNT